MIVLSVGEEIWDEFSLEEGEGDLFLFATSVSSFSRVQIAFSTNDYPMSHGFLMSSFFRLGFYRDRDNERRTSCFFSFFWLFPFSFSFIVRELKTRIYSLQAW